MKLKMNALVRLSRYREYLFFVMVTTLLGAISSYAAPGWRLVGVILANWLAVAFAFMINDVEDAPEDALNPAKVRRNPVSAAHLSPKAARLASFSVALLSASVYALLGFWPFIMGLCCLVIGFLYSWRSVRLKTIPFVDMLSHCFMLAGLQFLAAFFTFEPTGSTRWIFPFITILAISLYGELFNELRDLDEDVKAGLTHTASLLGARVTHWVMMFLLAVGIGSAFVTVFVIRLFPWWVLQFMVILAVILAVPALLRARRHRSLLELQGSFQKPLEIATALALMAQFVVVWTHPLLTSIGF